MNSGREEAPSEALQPNVSPEEETIRAYQEEPHSLSRVRVALTERHLARLVRYCELAGVTDGEDADRLARSAIETFLGRLEMGSVSENDSRCVPTLLVVYAILEINEFFHERIRGSAPPQRVLSSNWGRSPGFGKTSNPLEPEECVALDALVAECFEHCLKRVKRQASPEVVRTLLSMLADSRSTGDLVSSSHPGRVELEEVRKRLMEHLHQRIERKLRGTKYEQKLTEEEVQRILQRSNIQALVFAIRKRQGSN